MHRVLFVVEKIRNSFLFFFYCKKLETGIQLASFVLEFNLTVTIENVS